MAKRKLTEHDDNDDDFGDFWTPGASDDGKPKSKTVKSDRWDQSYYRRIRTELKNLRAATNALEEVTPTARPEMNDVFQMFMKSYPEFLPEDRVRDDHKINLVVNQQLIEFPEYRDTLRFTRGDSVAAAMAAVNLEPELEVLFDREKLNQKKAEELQKLRDELQDKLQQLAQQMRQNPPQPPQEGEGEGDPQNGSGQAQGGAGDPQDGQGEPGGSGTNLDQEIQDLKDMIAAAEQALKDGLEETADSRSARLQQALSSVMEKARNDSENMRTWGLDPGQIKKISAEERFKLAEKLNTRRLRQISEFFGPLKNLAFSTKKRVVPGTPHEMIGITLGDDLSRLLPSEMISLGDDDMEWSFLANLAEKRLQQYKMQGREKVGKGGIIAMVDQSGSMGGQRETWAVALLLVLMNIAKMENREIHVIYFSGPGQTVHFPFTSQSDFTFDRLMEVAECTIGGGTDFVTPLNQGIEILEKEFKKTGYVESDMLLITDGECGVTDNWLSKFHEKLDAISGTCWAVSIGNSLYDGNILSKISRGAVTDIQELTPEGTRHLKEVFSGMQRPGKPAEEKKDKK